MAFQRGPNIVTNGLVLALDAGNSKSYVSGSTIWYDKSGYNNSGSLVNDPTFSSTNGGSIVFDGSNDYIACGNNTAIQITVGTISSWVKASNSNTGYRGILVKQTAWGIFVKDNIFMTYDWGNGADRSTGINITNGTWKNTVMTFTEITGSPTNNAILYLDGVAVLTATVRYSGNKALTIGAGSPDPTQHFNGNIALATVYNRVLSPSEVLQNYNAQKSRFEL